jgi:dTDP-4-amino-4,6-dideoxy-D-galactose acyltransferase
VRPAAETAACTLLPWDSDFWGVLVGRVEEGELTAERLAAVDEWAQSNDVACLYFLADGDDPASAHTAERGGFRLMDLRVELRRPSSDERALQRLRDARPSDAQALRRIARSSHGITRFYADPNFGDDRCDDLYDIWISRSLEGWAEGVLVADVEYGAAGYVSCHLDDANATGSIGLIAVDERARGAGIGVDLARGAVGWCHARGAETMSVVTQGRNVGALRTFQRAGFLVDSVGLWFHKWYRP